MNRISWRKPLALIAHRYWRIRFARRPAKRRSGDVSMIATTTGTGLFG
jgi:hypothetical protein